MEKIKALFLPTKILDPFVSLDEKRAPNVKQYLRGLRNYYVLSQNIKVGNFLTKN